MLVGIPAFHGSLAVVRMYESTLVCMGENRNEYSQVARVNVAMYFVSLVVVGVRDWKWAENAGVASVETRLWFEIRNKDSAWRIKLSLRGCV